MRSGSWSPPPTVFFSCAQLAASDRAPRCGPRRSEDESWLRRRAGVAHALRLALRCAAQRAVCSSGRLRAVTLEKLCAAFPCAPRSTQCQLRGCGCAPHDEDALVEHLEEGDLAQGGGRDAFLLHLQAGVAM